LRGVGALFAGRRSSGVELRGRVGMPAAAGAAVVVATVALGGRSWAAAASFGIATFVLVANAGELGRVISSFARWNRRPLLAAFSAAVTRNRRLVGALVVHSGVAVAACAIAASAFASQTEISLERGQQVGFQGYVLRYEGLRPQPEPQRLGPRAPARLAPA